MIESYLKEVIDPSSCIFSFLSVRHRQLESCYQRLYEALYSGRAFLLKRVNLKMIFKVPGGHIAIFRTKALRS